LKLREKTTATLLIAIFMISTFAIVMPVSAQTTWTVGSGDSIQTAINNANQGDTILVAAGTYAENLVIDKSLTVKSIDGAETTTIDAQGENFGVFIIGATTTATFEGFTVLNYETCGILAGSFGEPEEDPLEVHILNNVVGVPSPLVDNHNNNIQIGDGTTGTIIGNTVYGAHLVAADWSGSGIIVAGSNGVLISNNYAYSCDLGISIVGYAINRDAPAVNNIVEYNFVESNLAGISVQMNSIGTIIRYNDVLNNDVGIESAGNIVWEPTIPSGTKIHYNNIVGNTEYGIASIVWDETLGEPEEVDATLNWWGDASGPGGVGSGSGDAVSTYVNYDPWLAAPYPSKVTGGGWFIDDKESDNKIHFTVQAKGGFVKYRDFAPGSVKGRGSVTDKDEGLKATLSIDQASLWVNYDGPGTFWVGLKGQAKIYENNRFTRTEAFELSFAVHPDRTDRVDFKIPTMDYHVHGELIDGGGQVVFHQDSQYMSVYE